MIIVYFDKHTMAQQTILLISCLNHDPSIKIAYLLHLSYYQVTFHEMFPHSKLVFFVFATLDTTGQIDSC